MLVRRNIIFMLMSIEIMLNAAGLAFVVAGARWEQPDGQVMFLFILAMAAAEVSVGLALVLQLYRRFKTLDVDARQPDARLTMTELALADPCAALRRLPAPGACGRAHAATAERDCRRASVGISAAVSLLIAFEFVARAPSRPRFHPAISGPG